MSEQQTEVCDNCFKSFPQSKIATHFGYCRRNIKKCQKCGEMYDINFTQQHEEEFHKLSSCQYCKKSLKPNQIGKHEDKCEARTQFCEYCQLDVPIKDYGFHLKQCQARTKQCQKCRKPISNKDYLIHTISCNGIIEEPKPAKTSNMPNKYSDFIQYTRNQPRAQEISRNQYKPNVMQGKRDISRGARQVKPEHGQSNNMYNVARQIKKDVGGRIIRQGGSNQVKNTPNYADINMNRNPVNLAEKKVILSSVNKKDRYTRVEPNVGNKIDYGKNIGSGKVIENKYTPSSGTRVVNPTVNEYQPSNYTNANRKNPNQVPSKVITTTTTYTRPYQPIQGTQNTKPSQQIPSNNYYPLIQQNHKKQIPTNKDVYIKRETQKFKYPEQKKQTNYGEYSANYQGLDNKNHNFNKQQTKKYQQPTRNVPKQSNIPSRDYKPTQQQLRQYVPPQNTYMDSRLGDHEQDEELQKAILASMGNLKVSSPTHNVQQQQSKPQYKIDQIPPQFLQNDMLNESFYGKQMALYQQIQRNNKRR